VQSHYGCYREFPTPPSGGRGLIPPTVEQHSHPPASGGKKGEREREGGGKGERRKEGKGPPRVG